MKKSLMQTSSLINPPYSGLTSECLKILLHQSIEQNNKWLLDNKINSYTLRNDKAGDIITTVNYIFQKLLVSGKLPERGEALFQSDENFLLSYLFTHYKSSPKKSIEFCHLLKHFSLWDYEFQFFYDVFTGHNLQNINLYLQCRNHIIQSTVNKYKKSVMSGVLAEIQEWSKLAQNIFKSYDQRVVIQEFVEVVKLHYVEVKKNQNQKINGAEFFKICQIMADKIFQQNSQFIDQKSGKNFLKTQKINEPTVGQIFRESLINDLTIEDRELIRILSCKDKNIARLLEEKHNKVYFYDIKMVAMIGDEVDSLRRDIEMEKRKYLEVIEEKKVLFQLIEKIKRKGLEYIMQNSVRNQMELLETFQNYNKKYNPHSSDVQKCRNHIENKRLLQIIEEEQKMP